ncbi:hypothetical protein D3C76_1506610 [compost metagenome]
MPLLLQVQHYLEGIVEQQGFDLRGKPYASDEFIGETNRKESGQRGDESVLGVGETQASIRLGSIEPGVPGNGRADSCAGPLAHGLVRLANDQ